MIRSARRRNTTLRMTDHSHRSKLSVLGFVAMLVLAVPTAPAAAQSADPPREVAVGPYAAVVDVTHEGRTVTINASLMDSGSRQPVQEARVRVIGTPQPGTEPVIADATETKAGEYGAGLTLPGSGDWLLELEVQADSDVHRAEIEVVELGSGSEQASQFLFLGIMAVLAGGAGYLYWSSSRARRDQSRAGGASDERKSPR